MASGQGVPVQWLEQPLPLLRSSGATEEAPFSAIVEKPDDPVIAVRCQHPVIQLGFDLLASHIFQLAMAPADTEEWTERLFKPPTRAQLDEALAPYKSAFLLSGTTYPFLQVKPLNPGPPEHLPISNILPDTPTSNAIKNGADFFVKRGNYGAIHAGLIAPLLYSGTVLFASGGGGYHDAPHGQNSPKYQVIGRTLWETLWLNVLEKSFPEYRSAAWPPPLDGTVFPWLRDDVRALDLERQSEGKKQKLIGDGRDVLNTVITVGAGDRHPAGFAMPRRYLLGPPRHGKCSVTGREGLVYDTYQRWPQGLSYDAAGWTAPYVAPTEKLDADGAVQKRSYVQSSGPLRLDDWLSQALDEANSRINEPKKDVAHPPPVVRALRGRMEHLIDAFEDEDDGTNEASVAAPELPIRIRVVTQFAFDKAVGGMSERSLPIYRLDDARRGWLATETAEVSRQTADIAKKLGDRAKEAVKLGTQESKHKLPGQLEDAVKREMEGRILDCLPRLAALLTSESGENPEARKELTDGLLAHARRYALTLFDSNFPVDSTDAVSARYALIRRYLRNSLYPRPRGSKAKTATGDANVHG